MAVAIRQHSAEHVPLRGPAVLGAETGGLVGGSEQGVREGLQGLLTAMQQMQQALRHRRVGTGGADASAGAPAGDAGSHLFLTIGCRCTLANRQPEDQACRNLHQSVLLCFVQQADCPEKQRVSPHVGGRPPLRVTGAAAAAAADAAAQVGRLAQAAQGQCVRVEVHEELGEVQPEGEVGIPVRILGCLVERRLESTHGIFQATPL
mmetsp:Transcript_28548/g.72284  ORF Transcript_28548/g.72284 Transcript_28548/m.72284 type:complete len:206 (+) Transcript_28548:497-1114(+)